MSRKCAIASILSRKSMITRLSIAFEDFLGSSIASQVMPSCLKHNLFVAIWIFVAIYTLFGRLWTEKLFFCFFLGGGWHTFRMIALVPSKLKEKFDVWGMKRWWSWKQGKYETRSAFANLLSESTGSSSLLEGGGKYTGTFSSTSSKSLQITSNFSSKGRFIHLKRKRK